jgi:hypothetical protein
MAFHDRLFLRPLPRVIQGFILYRADSPANRDPLDFRTSRKLESRPALRAAAKREWGVPES